MFQNWFDRFDEWINDTEGSLVNALTAFAPWLAPLAPAYMTYRHMVEFLDFPNLLAFCLALLVEILGFGTVSTFLDFWFHNKKERSEAKKAPLGIVVFSFGFYLCLILGSNVIIDVAKAFGTESQALWAIIVVRSLLTLQTIPGALIVAVRTGHRDLLKQIKKEKAEKVSESKQKVSESKRKDGKEVSETFRNFPKDWRSLEPMLTKEQVTEIASLSPENVREWANGIGVSEKTITNWRSNARDMLQ